MALSSTNLLTSLGLRLYHVNFISSVAFQLFGLIVIASPKMLNRHINDKGNIKLLSIGRPLINSKKKKKKVDY